MRREGEKIKKGGREGGRSEEMGGGNKEMKKKRG